MPTLRERLVRAAQQGGSITFVGADDPVTVPWAELHDDALRVAATLQAQGVRVGDHVAILGPTTRDLVTTIQAVWLAGGTVMVLPLPMRMGSIEEFVAQTRARVLHGDTDLLVIDPQLAPFLEAHPSDPTTVQLDDLVAASGHPYTQPPDDDERLAVLQFTSGSTSDPKGVMLPDHVLCSNLDAVTVAGRLELKEDVFVSWLPLYHDMGLVGMLTVPMSFGSDLVLAAPQDFMASPSRWVEWLSTYGGTVTAGPNFAWVLAARALRRLEGLDLSRLRMALNGAEPVDPATIESLVAAGAAHGLRPGAIFPAFGMAEVCIGGTFPEPMRGLVTDDVDQRVLETEGYAAPVDPGSLGSRSLARLGPPVPGMELRIVDPATGDVRQEREVGELEMRGTSLTSGYYKHPEATADAFHDGWLRTGDLAYTVDGELVICGRIKDLIIVAGRNVFPEDIERAVAGIDGVRAGNVIAFGVDGERGRQGLVVVAESKAADVEPVRREVALRVRDVVGLPVKEIVLVSPGTLPKTSSGKLQRALCRTRYLDEGLALL
jgi:fatty-acyl-CoA synthase